MANGSVPLCGSIWIIPAELHFFYPANSLLGGNTCTTRSFPVECGTGKWRCLREKSSVFQFFLKFFLTGDLIFSF